MSVLRIDADDAGIERFRGGVGVVIDEQIDEKGDVWGIRHVRPLRRAGALPIGVLIMPIEKWSDRITIVHLSPDPQLSEDLQTAQDLAGAPGVTSGQGPDVVLDFAAVKYLNSSHIARLLKLRKAMIAAGNHLVLCAVDTQVWGAFLVTGLDKIFEFTDSVPTALAGLQINQQS
jgi:anti-anti-sigma factor